MPPLEHGATLCRASFHIPADPRNATATLHVSRLPPNPAVIAPGPALIFVVVPSVGVKAVMLGSGQLGVQQTLNSSSNFILGLILFTLPLLTFQTFAF